MAHALRARERASALANLLKTAETEHEEPPRDITTRFCRPRGIVIADYSSVAGWSRAYVDARGAAKVLEGDAA